MRKIVTALLSSVLLIGVLSGCTGLGDPAPGPDSQGELPVAPCTAHPEDAPPGTVISGTLCVEVIDRKATLLRRFVDIHADAVDQYGGHGGNTTSGRYPFDKTVDSSWSHDLFLGLGTQREPLVVTVRWSAIYQGKPGDVLVCYLLTASGYEDHSVYQHATVVATTKPVSVSCATTLHTGGNDA